MEGRGKSLFLSEYESHSKDYQKQEAKVSEKVLVVFESTFNVHQPGYSMPDQ